ncbi:MAG: hypothetical protein IOD12_13330 [Silvanigrellales bacterium]|nr:hypothetical protein [Silvanigrellales bacterium]
MIPPPRSARRVLIVGDSLHKVNPASDSSLALAESAMDSGHEVHWCEPSDVGIFGADVVVANAQRLVAAKTADLRWVPSATALGRPILQLTHFSDVWVRKDPPFNESYKTLCWILASQSAVPVANPAELLLAHHEKALQLRARAEGVLKDWEIIPTCVTSNTLLAKAFLDQYEADAKHLARAGSALGVPVNSAAGSATLGQALHPEVQWVVKPWLGHGGFDVEAFAQACEALAHVEQQFQRARDSTANQPGEPTWMIQPFLPQVRTAGDRRVFLVAGEILCDFVRIPKEGHIASNLAQGGRPELAPMTDTQRNICERLALWLDAKGILIAGVDLIDTFVGEINITSPTGLRTFESLSGRNVASRAVELLFARSAL